MNNPIKQATLKEATRIIKLINMSDDYNCYFESFGGKIRVILEEKIVKIINPFID